METKDPATGPAWALFCGKAGRPFTKEEVQVRLLLTEEDRETLPSTQWIKACKYVPNQKHS